MAKGEEVLKFKFRAGYFNDDGFNQQGEPIVLEEVRRLGGDKNESDSEVYLVRNEAGNPNVVKYSVNSVFDEIFIEDAVDSNKQDYGGSSYFIKPTKIGVVESEGSTYPAYIMDYSGSNLRDVHNKLQALAQNDKISEQVLSAFAGKVSLSIASALGAIHKKKVYHGDLLPHNVTINLDVNNLPKEKVDLEKLIINADVRIIDRAARKEMGSAYRRSYHDPAENAFYQAFYSDVSKNDRIALIGIYCLLRGEKDDYDHAREFANDEGLKIIRKLGKCPSLKEIISHIKSKLLDKGYFTIDDSVKCVRVLRPLDKFQQDYANTQLKMDKDSLEVLYNDFLKLRTQASIVDSEEASLIKDSFSAIVGQIVVGLDSEVKDIMARGKNLEKQRSKYQRQLTTFKTKLGTVSSSIAKGEKDLSNLTKDLTQGEPDRGEILEKMGSISGQVLELKSDQEKLMVDIKDLEDRIEGTQKQIDNCSWHSQDESLRFVRDTCLPNINENVEKVKLGATIDGHLGEEGE